MIEDLNFIELPKTVQEKMKNNISMLDKKNEEPRGEIVFKNCQFVNRMDKYVAFENDLGLKNIIIAIMRRFVSESYSEKNVCTWQVFCDCQL